eukprot:6644068-Ditylum_brightwellii.AAC.1
MLFYVPEITLSFLLSPSLAGSFAPHRFLHDRTGFALGPLHCGSCKAMKEYVDGFCCGMHNIGDICNGAIYCFNHGGDDDDDDDNFDDDELCPIQGNPFCKDFS